MTDRLPEDANWIGTLGVDRRAAMAGATAALGYALAAQPVSSAAITTPSDGLVAGTIEIPVGEIRMNAYRAKPAGRKAAPVVLVVHEIFGVHEWIRDITRRFARAGYHAIAPDLFQRAGDATKQPDFKLLLRDIVGKTPDSQVMADLDAVVAHAATDGGNADRLGVTGFCWGGRITWLYANHNPKLDAGVAWYGRLIGDASPGQPKHPIDVAAALRAPVLGLYGALDKGIPVADVERMNAALKAAKDPSFIRLFEGADHGFLADYRPSFNEAASKAAWADAVAWFGRHLA